MLDLPLIDVAIAYLTAHSGEDVVSTLSRYPDLEKKSDGLSRTLLHVAASQGKNEVIRWLYKRGANILATDHESHWTALHRAAFYGYLGTVNLLIQLAAESGRTSKKGHEGVLERLLSARDKDGYTYLDLLVADESPRRTREDAEGEGSNVTFTWGLNANSILGHEKSQVIQVPDQVDCFRRLGVSMSMVSVGTYHTIFLSQSGEVYTCGHGIGGRLGHGDERSLLTPKRVATLSREKCKWVSASFNQSYFVTRSDMVYACGMNSSNILCQGNGAEKLLTPKPLEAKVLKGHMVERVFGLKNHVVIQTSSAIYTSGLNAGQLGHPKIDNERRIVQPRCVTKVRSVNHVAVSDAATVVATREGHVFLLQDYTCKKIFTSKSIADVCVSGGRLDESSFPDRTSSDHVRPQELVILLLCQTGKVFAWTDVTKTFKLLSFHPRRISAHHISLSRGSNVLVVTSDEGQLWQGHVPLDPRGPSTCVAEAQLKTTRSPLTLDWPMKSTELVEVQLTRVPRVHRVQSATVDDKGTSFALIASNPNVRGTSPTHDSPKSADPPRPGPLIPQVWFGFYPSSSTENQQTFESSSRDLVLKSSDGDLFTCHRDILTSRVPYFESMFRQYDWDINSRLGWCESSVGTSPTSMDMTTTVLAIFLSYIYSNSLDFCNQKDLDDCNIMCQCLMAADQYVADDFKSCVELRLCTLIDLKNVTRLASLAVALQAETLESSTMEFICSNAPCLVESGAFLNVEPEVMDRISSAYRNYVGKKSYRTITSYELGTLPGELRDGPVQTLAKKKRRPKVASFRESIREDDEGADDSSPQTSTFPQPSPSGKDRATPPTPAPADTTVIQPDGRAEVDAVSMPETQKTSKGPSFKKVSQKARKEEERKRRQLEKEGGRKSMPPGGAPISVLTPVQPPINPWKIPKSTNSSSSCCLSPATSPDSLAPPTPSFKAIMELDMIGQGPKIAERSKAKDHGKGRSNESTSYGSTNQNNIKYSSNNSFDNGRIASSFGLVVTSSRNLRKQSSGEPKAPEATSPRPSAWGKLPETPRFPIRVQGGEEGEVSDGFLSILEKEVKEHETRHRVTNKSLHLVQLEERAIEELKAHYGADLGHERIVITRAPFATSRPLWAATQHRKHPPS